MPPNANYAEFPVFVLAGLTVVAPAADPAVPPFTARRPQQRSAYGPSHELTAPT
jgi:hypothetical protein